MRPLALLFLLLLTAACAAQPPPTPTSAGPSVAESLAATLFAPTATPTPTLTPTLELTPTHTPTPTPSPVPTPTPSPTSTPSPAPPPNPAEDFTAGYAWGKQCGAAPTDLSDAYWDGWWEAYRAYCRPTPIPTATPTVTPMPRPAVSAPADVWACFLSRDDSVKDEDGTVLSQCGWRESSLSYVVESAERRGDYQVAERLRNRPSSSPFLQQGYDRKIVLEVETPAGPERTEQIGQLAEVLKKLSMLLRIGFFILPEEYLDKENAVFVHFEDVEYVGCGSGAVKFLGCASYTGEEQTVQVAVRNKTDEELYWTIMHELLHILVFMGHAREGIMATGHHYDGSTELTDMDIAQLWLFSNPAFHADITLGEEPPLMAEVLGMVQVGEWDEAPPGLNDAECTTQALEDGVSYVKCVPGHGVDAVQRCLRQLLDSPDYLFAIPRTQRYLEQRCLEGS